MHNLNIPYEQMGEIYTIRAPHLLSGCMWQGTVGHKLLAPTYTREGIIDLLRNEAAVAYRERGSKAIHFFNERKRDADQHRIDGIEKYSGVSLCQMR